MVSVVTKKNWYTTSQEMAICIIIIGQSGVYASLFLFKNEVKGLGAPYAKVI